MSEQEKDGLAQYVEEVEKLRNGSYYYIMAVTIGPNKDGRPEIIPMMIADGLDLAKQQIKVVDGKGNEQMTEGNMTVQTAFIQAIGHAVRFGFSRLPWEGYDKQAIAMELLQAIQTETPEEGGKEVAPVGPNLKIVQP